MIRDEVRKHLSDGTLRQLLRKRKFTSVQILRSGVSTSTLREAGVLYTNRKYVQDENQFPLLDKPCLELLECASDACKLRDVLLSGRHRLSEYYSSGITTVQLFESGVDICRDMLRTDENDIPVVLDADPCIQEAVRTGRLMDLLHVDQKSYLLAEYYASGVTTEQLRAVGCEWMEHKQMLKNASGYPSLASNRKLRIKKDRVETYSDVAFERKHKQLEKKMMKDKKRKRTWHVLRNVEKKRN